MNQGVDIRERYMNFLQGLYDKLQDDHPDRSDEDIDNFMLRFITTQLKGIRQSQQEHYLLHGCYKIKDMIIEDCLEEVRAHLLNQVRGV